ncbi:hypothetical protein MHM84_03645 [Halomonas sp. McH1-25]|uniref:hypothetical protein n=1 Tax=unclassified Halomonas TaxID=2609666 RepID=UPI001EF45EF3|nr:MULTISPECIES: hypothetical protein [unclassified Halomonas]MCG7598866.1 hypothetical protein [Halomonas sp. McH1-25]MCP1340829.1 hypothetical protein [Halomonas sp. FL8]MCP1361288.1 hypothetical protein [Halomonas sp. BBD45]MCP1363685.1 hypothetical protein [Halomonas sp. BBD48]
MIRRLMDIMVPRFITEDVACYEGEDGISYPAFCMADFDHEHDEAPDAIIRMRSFNLFGFSILPRMAGEVMEYDEWLNTQR